MEYVFLLPRLYSAVHLTTIQFSRAEAGWTFPTHRHPFFEFLYCASGELEQTVAGQSYRLRPGDGMVIRSGLDHSTRTGVETTFFDFHFDIDLPDVHVLFQTLEEPVFANEAMGGRVKAWVDRFLADYGPPVGKDGGFNGAVGGSGSVPGDGVTGAPADGAAESVRGLQMQSSVLQLVGMLAERALAGEGAPRAGRASRSRVEIAHEAARLLETAGDDAVRIGELAARLNVNRTHIANCFKSVYGVSPKAYLMRVRLRKARQLLSETNATVEEIAAQLSFSSTGHFSRFFRAQTGMPPLQYRTSQKLS